MGCKNIVYQFEYSLGVRNCPTHSHNVSCQFHQPQEIYAPGKTKFHQVKIGTRPDKLYNLSMPGNKEGYYSICNDCITKEQFSQFERRAGHSCQTRKCGRRFYTSYGEEAPKFCNLCLPFRCEECSTYLNNDRYEGKSLNHFICPDCGIANKRSKIVLKELTLDKPKIKGICIRCDSTCEDTYICTNCTKNNPEYSNVCAMCLKIGIVGERIGQGICKECCDKETEYIIVANPDCCVYGCKNQAKHVVTKFGNTLLKYCADHSERCRVCSYDIEECPIVIRDAAYVGCYDSFQFHQKCFDGIYSTLPEDLRNKLQYNPDKCKVCRANVLNSERLKTGVKLCGDCVYGISSGVILSCHKCLKYDVRKYNINKLQCSLCIECLNQLEQQFPGQYSSTSKQYACRKCGSRIIENPVILGNVVAMGCSNSKCLCCTFCEELPDKSPGSTVIIEYNKRVCDKCVPQYDSRILS